MSPRWQDVPAADREDVVDLLTEKRSKIAAAPWALADVRAARLAALDAALACLAETDTGEAERIAAAEMARDVAWVRAIEACGGNSARYVQYVFNVPGYYDAARVQYAANHGDDIAAAIRAARGENR